MRRGRSALALCCAAVTLTACGAAGSREAAEPVQLLVTCDPACIVYVDDVPRARAEPTVALRLAPDAYRVQLAAPGYLTARFDVRLARRSVELLHAMWPAEPGDGSPPGSL